jgi:hypothetical protein
MMADPPKCYSREVVGIPTNQRLIDKSHVSGCANGFNFEFGFRLVFHALYAIWRQHI